MTSKTFKTNRRGFLKTVGLGGAAATAAIGAPWLWIPKAHANTIGFGSAKHLIYLRLSGGFRFTTGFNCDVADEFSPWGVASGVASGTEWGPSKLLETATGDGSWYTSELQSLGVPKFTDVTNEVAVMACVDHEPLAGSADGNHQTGLERFLTGYVNGQVGLFTMINYGLRADYELASMEGRTLLPAIIMGQPGMGRGSGDYAAYRPPVMRGDDLGRFGFDTDSVLPEWARTMSNDYDERYRAKVKLPHYPTIDAYLQSREATKAYAEIFSSDPLKINNGSTEAFDGVSNADLAAVFGQGGASSNIRLALRLFHYGCPAVYLDQGGYDYHSGEEQNLPGQMQGLTRLLSGLFWALKTMQHPDGGSYWDHTIVSLGSEFSRTTRGGRFNSARGSDHGGDYSTRWMSMPFFGGPIAAAGRRIGETAASDLAPLGKVVSYRATMKTLFDALGCEHSEFFPADEPYDDLFIA